MSDDLEDPPVVVRGREVDRADLKTNVEAENPGHSELGKGLAYLGLGVILYGVVTAIARLPSDLSETTAATLEPSVGPMLAGTAFLAIGGAVAVLLSPPAMSLWGRLYERVTGDAAGTDPLEPEVETDD